MLPGLVIGYGFKESELNVEDPYDKIDEALIDVEDSPLTWFLSLDDETYYFLPSSLVLSDNSSMEFPIDRPKLNMEEFQTVSKALKKTIGNTNPIVYKWYVVAYA